MDISLEIGHLRKLFRFLRNAFNTAAAHASSLVKGYGAEIAGAEAASVMCYRKLDLLDSGDPSVLFVHRVVIPYKRQGIYRVKLFSFKRRHGRILHQHPVAVILHNGLSSDVVIVFVLYGIRLCVLFPVRFQLVVAVAYRLAVFVLAHGAREIQLFTAAAHI